MSTLRSSGLCAICILFAMCLGCTNDPTSEKVIMEGRLASAPGEPRVAVRILSLIDPSTSYFDRDEFQRTRVEIGTEPTIVFLLPESMTFAAEKAQLQDLNDDGVDEILLFSGDEVAVVSLSSRKPLFREHEDVLKSWGDPDLVISKTAGVVLIAWKPFPNSSSDEQVPTPEVFKWNPAKGFVDVTSENPTYVIHELIPQYLARIESAPERSRKTYGRALQQLRNKVGQR